MSKLYRVLRKAIAYGLDLYFIDIQTIGTEHVPEAGPVIFTANHPNSIMDTLLLGTRTARQVHYLARSGLFDNPAVAALFNATGMIPVYRQQDAGDTSNNQSTFARAYELLESGRCLGIFPEGRNSEERRVLDIKTGAARIALGAEARNDFRLGVKIVPVGINFQDRDRFLTSVLLRFGPPIDAHVWAESYREDEREAARELTARIQTGIREQTVHVAQNRVLALTQELMEVSGGELLVDLASHDEDIEALLPIEVSRHHSTRKALMDRFRLVGEDEDLVRTLDLEQALGDALADLLERDPARFAELRAATRAYIDHLKQVELRRDFGARHPATLSSRKDALAMTAYAILFGPLAGWGYVHNVLPYQLTKVIALRAEEEAIRAMTAFGVGAMLFALWYGLIWWILWSIDERTAVYASLYLVVMLFTGFLFLKYRRRVAGWRDRILARTIFRTQRNLVQTLLREREDLLDDTAEVLNAYLGAHAHEEE